MAVPQAVTAWAECGRCGPRVSRTPSLPCDIKTPPRSTPRSAVARRRRNKMTSSLGAALGMRQDMSAVGSRGGRVNAASLPSLPHRRAGIVAAAAPPRAAVAATVTRSSSLCGGSNRGSAGPLRSAVLPAVASQTANRATARLLGGSFSAWASPLPPARRRAACGAAAGDGASGAAEGGEGGEMSGLKETADLDAIIDRLVAATNQQEVRLLAFPAGGMARMHEEFVQRGAHPELATRSPTRRRITPCQCNDWTQRLLHELCWRGGGREEGRPTWRHAQATVLSSD
eukprot:360407-Chlamydomonas_euryale.AAC.2